MASSSKIPLALTGSSGIVGRALVSHLLALGDYDLICIDVAPPPADAPALPEGSVFRLANLTDPEETRKAMAGAKELVHFAAFPNPVGREGLVTFNT